MSSNLNVIAKGAAFIFSGFFVSKILAYVYRVILARNLGPTDFGILSIGLAFHGIVIVFAALGLYQGVLHFVAVYDSRGKPQKVRGAIFAGLRLQLTTALAFAAGLFLLSDYIAINFFEMPSLSPVLKIVAVAIPFEVLTSNLMIITQAFRKIEYKVLLRNILENSSKIIFTLALLYLGLGLVGASLALTVSSVIAFAAGLFIVQKKVYPLFKKGVQAKYNFRELFRYSWPLFAVGFFAVLMTAIDTIMLGYLDSAYSTGIYNVAAPTAHILTIPSFAFETLFLPVVTALYAQRKMRQLNSTYKTVTRWIFSMVFPATLFTVLFAPEILSVMFGSVYAAGAPALAILSIGIFLVSFFGPVRSMLESISKTRLILYNTLIATALNIVLNITLIPLIGIKGAALATAVSFVVWNLLAWFEVYAVTKLHPYNKAYMKPVLAACAVTAAFFFAKDLLPQIQQLSFPFSLILLLFLAATFVALYAFLFLVSRGLQPEDKEILLTIERKTGFRSNSLRSFVKRFVD